MGQRHSQAAGSLVAVTSGIVRDRVVRFGPFEFDAHSGELRKGPTLLKVLYQPIEILKSLLERLGAGRIYSKVSECSVTKPSRIRTGALASDQSASPRPPASPGNRGRGHRHRRSGGVDRPARPGWSIVGGGRPSIEHPGHEFSGSGGRSGSFAGRQPGGVRLAA